MVTKHNLKFNAYKNIIQYTNGIFKFIWEYLFFRLTFDAILNYIFLCNNNLNILIASDIISDYLMFQVLVTTQMGHQICYHVSLLYQNLWKKCGVIKTQSTITKAFCQHVVYETFYLKFPTVTKLRLWRFNLYSEHKLIFYKKIKCCKMFSWYL